ncbi:putative porin [Parabacteroides sp. PF5-9]|uniref:putative porin n=1 Tax=Parabacteroides sp. PF5-9 TaxID=1742404 RepID=UPI002476F291|nr:putative porin [Parabacteroides sp. PF5-9]MDH6358001.1 hypothetical protein [Parabacteroides sp. PF5-9]
MKHCLNILLLLLLGVSSVDAQQGGDLGERSAFSLQDLTSSDTEIPDSLLFADSAAIRTQNTIAYRLTPLLGEAYVVPIDTGIFNSSNRTLVESNSVAVGYLANFGSGAQSKIFNERKEARDFMFADPFDYYIIDDKNACFYDTKVPYTNILYTFGGGSDAKADHLKGVLTSNFSKKINVGAEMDYIFSRGHYASNGNKLLTYRFFGSYRSDRYEMNAFVRNYHFALHENGGIRNIGYITNPDTIADDKSPTSKGIKTRLYNYINRVRGKQFYLTHRYNLGFHRTIGETVDEEGNPIDINVFVPVSSIIHTINYEDNRRRAYVGSGENTRNIDYEYPYIYRQDTAALNDRAESWKLSNTFALSLREGFQDWAKFGLTAFVNMEKRQFKLQPIGPENPSILSIDPENPTVKPSYPEDLTNYEVFEKFDEFSTYLGAELSKRRGSVLTYNARGELCVVGDDIGEFRLNGEIQTKFSLFKKEAGIRLDGYINNLTPAFFYRHNRSRYFQWDYKLKNEKRVYAGGTIDLESSKTQLSAGVTSLTNYVYFDQTGHPNQYENDIQIITARLKQDFHYRAFGWENEAVYQYTSKKEILPLPQVSVYSNMYVVFKPVSVLTVQLGANLYYHTDYYAPYYEPATMQFQLQPENGFDFQAHPGRQKIGSYPLINAYANLHLKQARFFVMAYNVGSKFVDPNYFSLPNYPLDPMVIKIGISVNFNN